MPGRRHYNTPQIVQPGSHRIAYWLFALLIVALAVGWHSFDFGREQAVVDAGVMGDELERLRSRVPDLESERDSLRAQVAALERSSQIDREASRQLLQELKQHQDERMKLEGELVFLRGLLSDGATREGIQIHRFRIEPSGQERGFRYRFTVSKALQDNGTATGFATLAVSGQMEGEALTLNLDDLTDEKLKQLTIHFKHFQDVEGVILLPAGFEPENVVVEIKPKNKGLSPLTQSYEWGKAG